VHAALPVLLEGDLDAMSAQMIPSSPGELNRVMIRQGIPQTAASGSASKFAGNLLKQFRSWVGNEAVAIRHSHLW
jgi:hypothetical protein